MQKSGLNRLWLRHLHRINSLSGTILSLMLCYSMDSSNKTDCDATEVSHLMCCSMSETLQTCHSWVDWTSVVYNFFFFFFSPSLYRVNRIQTLAYKKRICLALSNNITAVAMFNKYNRLKSPGGIKSYLFRGTAQLTLASLICHSSTGWSQNS